MINFEQTIIAQYANSETIVQLIRNFNGYVDPQTDFDNFYNYVWNIQTAQGFGLDILGRIVHVSRQLDVSAEVVNFGFDEGLNYQPFGQAPFYAGPPGTSVYLLSDEAYRTLILMKALLNISDSSAPTINQLLKNLFASRGRCYVIDMGQMSIRFVFEFALFPYEISILTKSNVIPRPAAVHVHALQLNLPGTFGFSEAISMQTFGHGVFFNPATSFITVD